LTSGSFRDVIEFDTETEEWYTIVKVHPNDISTLLVSVDNRLHMVQSGGDIIRFDPKDKPTKGRGPWFDNYYNIVVGKAPEFDKFLPQSIEYEGNVYWTGILTQQTAKFNLADLTVEIVGSGKYRKMQA